MQRVLLLFLTGLLLAAPLAAQETDEAVAPDAGETEAMDGYLELLRQDLRSGRVAILTEALQLTEEEGKVFWPLYREYSVEASALGDRYVETLRWYAEHWGSMTAEEIDQLADRVFTRRQDQLDLMKKYYAKVSESLSPRRAAQFLQIEGQISQLIEVQLASEIPLIR